MMTSIVRVVDPVEVTGVTTTLALFEASGAVSSPSSSSCHNHQHQILFLIYIKTCIVFPFPPPSSTQYMIFSFIFSFSFSFSHNIISGAPFGPPQPEKVRDMLFISSQPEQYSYIITIGFSAHEDIKILAR